MQRSPDESPQISGNYRDPRGHMSTSMSTHSMKVKLIVFNVNYVHAHYTIIKQSQG